MRGLMSAKKLLVPNATRYNPIPEIVRNSIKCIQNRIVQSAPPFIAKDPSVLSTNLIKSYCEKGLVREARVLFDEMPMRDVVAWTAMITGYALCEHRFQGWTLFCDMLRAEERPNEFSLSSVLKICKGMKDLDCGKLVHCLALKLDFQESMYVENALMDMYATLGLTMDDACSIFCNMSERTVVSWTTLIAGYTHRGDGYTALTLFCQMLMDGVELNPFSFSIAVRACASIGSPFLGQQMHGTVIKCGFQLNLPVMNSILDMYCRCSCLSEARKCFHDMGEKNLITWNTIIAGFERTDSNESLHIFSWMNPQGYSPNCFTFTSITAACGNLAILACGQQVHGAIVRRGLEGNMILANAFIDMYAKCGSIHASRKIFNAMYNRDLLSWTSMMIGYGAHGHGREAVELFDEMVGSGIRPDRIVFVAVLSACSHAGLVEEGLRYFELMTEKYKITPCQEIYGCVVDLLGRAGRVEEAYQLIQKMPFRPDESVWGALLGACRAHKLQNLGKLVAQRVLDSRPCLVGTYVMLSNVYAAEGIWGEFAEVRKMMRGIGSKKEAGRSWIEVKNQVFSFVVGDKMCPRVEEVYRVLDLLIPHMRESGYSPDSETSYKRKR
ncbi:hypothetical protein SAY86_027937 [Trapa natans]|uniref:Pentatricopeptide repeat-containing protein n=1 Tax=Trapa natans TaxID=22666 RepID=A0AAN7LYH5_TRANT|nr:hypothetical protein SAY86_027937 [Trapa natans]